MTEGGEATHGLLMPFVSVTSRGGPHDDDSYVAGWEVGALHTHLLGAQPDQHEQNILRVNRDQADLVAMHSGYSAKFEDIPEMPTWLYATFELQPHGRAARDQRRMAGMSITVNTGTADVAHADAVSVNVVDAHLLCLNAQGETVAVYAPGRWHDAKANRESPQGQP